MGIKILWLGDNGKNFVGGRSTIYGFERAVGKLVECQWAGKGWPLYTENESINETVERVMPDVDIVIDKDNSFKTPEKRKYKIGYFTGDIHAKWSYNIDNPLDHIKLLDQAKYDFIFMRYKHVYGMGVDHDIYISNLRTPNYWIPPSIDEKYFYPRNEKEYDIAFLGSYNRRWYPLRNELWKRNPSNPRLCNLEEYCESRRRILFIKHYIKKYGGDINKMLKRQGFVVGPRYSEILGRSKILIFGCSICKYPMMKYFEGMASGCLVVADRPGLAKELGFINSETYAKINIKNWRSILDYYLNNEEELNRIAQNGRNLILERHTHDIRAKQFVNLLEKIL